MAESEPISAVLTVEVTEATAEEIWATIKAIDATKKAAKVAMKDVGLKAIKDWVVSNKLAPSLEDYIHQMVETKKVVWVAVIDSRTAPYDASLNGRKFKYDDVARPYPPIHKNCRCRTDPIPDKQFKRHAWDI